MPNRSPATSEDLPGAHDPSRPPDESDAIISVSAGPSSADLTFDLETCRTAYQRLMAAYALLLGLASVERRDPESLEAILDSFRRRSSAFVEPCATFLARAHIRKRLRAVAVRCGQLEPALDAHNEQEARARGWLSEVRSAVDVTASELPSRRLPSFFVVVPFLIGLIPLAKPVVNAGVPGAVWLIGGFLLLIYALVLFRVVFAGYRTKRERFMPGATKIDLMSRADQREHAGPNIYRLEKELFEALGTERKPEGELDSWIVAVAGLLVVYFLIAFASWLSFTALIISLGVAMAMSLLIGVAAARVSIRRHRVWR